VEVFDTHLNINLMGKGANAKDQEVFRQIDKRANIRLGFSKALGNHFKKSELVFTLSKSKHVVNTHYGTKAKSWYSIALV